MLWPQICRRVVQHHRSREMTLAGQLLRERVGDLLLTLTFQDRWHTARLFV